MLKLERDSSLSGLTVRLRERERFFEPRLLQAFAFTLVVHCGALAMVHIAPFTVPSHFRFPPVQVQSDAAQEKARIVSLNLSDIYEELPPPLPYGVPTLDWLSLASLYTLPLSNMPNLQAFEALEEHLWPSWQEPLSLPIEKPLIQMTFGGDLAELSLLAKDPLLDQTEPLSKESHLSTLFYVSYRVQMDESTGMLFWYERLRSSRMEALDRLTEQILLNLRFDSSASEDAVTGEVHFAVSPKILGEA